MSTLQDITDRVRTAVGTDSGLGKSLKFNLKSDGVVLIDGATVSNEDKPADLTLTITADDLVAMGEGKLDPMHGHANGFKDFLTDYQRLIGAFEDRLPKPWIALGHSMGGCLTLLALATGENRFAGAILSAPMLALYTAPVPRPLGVALAAVMNGVGLGGSSVTGRPKAPIEETFQNNVLTHDRARYARNQAQVAACPDLALGGPTWG